MKLELTFAESRTEYAVGFTDDTAFEIGFESAMKPGQSTPFEGPYEVTPTRETQTLSTAGKLMLEALVVNPIPRNYGLISYNGFEITVS